PSPCVDCNSTVKFGALIGRARKLYECYAVATGQYARGDEGDDRAAHGGRVARGEPRSVARIDAAPNLVQLGRREDLERRTFEVRDVSFTAGRPPAPGAFDCEVRIRHRAEPVPAGV